MDAVADPLPVDLYIYYRVIDTAEAVARVRALQAAVAARSGVRGRLMRRRDEDATLMEIYPAVLDPAAFEAVLEEEVASHGLAELIEPGTARHVERFICA